MGATSAEEAGGGAEDLTDAEIFEKFAFDKEDEEGTILDLCNLALFVLFLDINMILMNPPGNPNRTLI